MKTENVTRCAEIVAMLCTALSPTHPAEADVLRRLGAAFCADVCQPRYHELYKFMNFLGLTSELVGLAFCALPSWDEDDNPVNESLFDEFAQAARKLLN